MYFAFISFTLATYAKVLLSTANMIILFSNQTRVHLSKPAALQMFILIKFEYTLQYGKHPQDTS